MAYGDCSSTKQQQQHPGHVAAWSMDSSNNKDHVGSCQDEAAASATATSSPAVHSPRSISSDAQVYVAAAMSPSIYHLYSRRRRNIILLAAAFTSILVPFSDTVYLPALAVSVFCLDVCSHVPHRQRHWHVQAQLCIHLPAFRPSLDG